MKINNTKITSSYLVFPGDLNPNGTIFGGKIMSLMDVEAAKLSYLAITATHCDNIVTKAISNIDFICPAFKGDLLNITAEIEKVGTKSITIKVKVDKFQFDGMSPICEASFVMVSMYKGNSTPHNLTLN